MVLAGWLPLSALCTLHAFLCIVLALSFSDVVDLDPDFAVSAVRTTAAEYSVGAGPVLLRRGRP